MATDPDEPVAVTRMRRELRRRALSLLSGAALLVLAGVLVYLPLGLVVLAVELLWYAGVVKLPRRRGEP